MEYLRTSVLTASNLHFFSFSQFQTDDIQKLQLIPLQKPLITSKHLHEKLIQPENDAVGVSQALHNNIGIENVSSANDNDDNRNVHDIEKPLQSAQSANDLARANSDSVADNEPLVITDRATTATVASTTTTGKPTTTTGVTSKSMKKDIKRTKRLEKKRLKQQQKQQKKLNKKAKKEKNNNKIKDEKTNNDNNSNSNKNPNEILQSNLKNRSHTFAEPTVPRAKSKSPVNVTFAFDTIENCGDANNRNQTTIVLHHSHKDTIDNRHHYHQHHNDDAAMDSKSIGEYDSLPLIKVEKSADQTIVDVDSDFVVESNNEKIDGNGNVVAKHAPLPISCSSSDSIPFIDDSPNSRRAGPIPIEPHRNLHDSRFITLQPRNIGAQSMIYARKLEKPLPIAFKIPTKRDQFDKSVQILYQSLKDSIDHHFDRVAHLHNKLCQVCHEFLLVPDAVKCLTCGLVCHHSCTMPQVIFFSYF